MIGELDTVVLTKDVPEHGLRRGDIGAVVHVHADGQAFEVEFVTLSGKTVAVATLPLDCLRPAGATEIAHARELA